METNTANYTRIGYDGCANQEIQPVCVEELGIGGNLDCGTLSWETLQKTDMSGDLIRRFSIHCREDSDMDARDFVLLRFRFGICRFETPAP